MRLVRSIKEFQRAFPGAPPVAVTIGNFDSVHRGHSHLFQTAASFGAVTGAVTFEPHPKVVLSGVGRRGLSEHPELWPVTPLATKLHFLQSTPLEFLFPIRFTAEFAALSAEEFLSRIIVEGLGAKAVVVGHDWAFGKGRSGNTELLKAVGERCGFQVIVVPPVLEHGERVSTSRVKRALAEGDTTALRLCLGRDYSLFGRVCRGDGRGRGLGFPTANLAPRRQLLPRDGVYATRVHFQGESLPAVTNIGVRPTFGGGGRTVETHVLTDRLLSMVHQKIELTFVARIRDEQRFSSAQELVQQIERDKEEAVRILSDKHASSSPSKLHKPAAPDQGRGGVKR